MTLTVAKLAERAGVNADTVRYYERVGLLPAPPRSAAGYRLYDQATAERLRFIKGAQRLGLRLHEVGELLEILDRGQCPCGHTSALLRQRLAEVDAELARLATLRAELAGLLGLHAAQPAPDRATSQCWCVHEFPDRR